MNQLDCGTTPPEPCRNPDGEPCRACLIRDRDKLQAALSRRNAVLMRLVRLAGDAVVGINEDV